MSDHFLACLEQEFKKQPKDGLLPTREKAWRQFLELGLPSKADEAYRYISFKELYASSLEKPTSISLEKARIQEWILPECKNSHIVFVDGQFAPDLSDVSRIGAEAMLLSLSEALRSHGSFLQRHFSELAGDEKEPFLFLNLALHAKGVFFYLPPQAQAVAPIQCLNITTGSHCAFPYLYLALGAHSNLQWISTHHQLDPQSTPAIFPFTTVTLEEGARLNLLNSPDPMPASWYFETVRATLKKSAHFDSLSVTLGAKTFRQNYRVKLKGEQAQANLNGLWMLGHHRTAHTHVTIEHEAPHTHSMQRFKGVLNGVSQSSFEGKILVRDVAQKTEAYQLNNNLILSEGAVANSKPNLEIFADDVKASHGATISQLDEEQLFYLSTRGIDDATARRLLIGGFCREMIEPILYSSLRGKMEEYIAEIVNAEEK